jgi:hypothetical protein
MSWVWVVAAVWLLLSAVVAALFIALVRFADHPSTDVDPSSTGPVPHAASGDRASRACQGVPPRRRPPARDRSPALALGPPGGTSPFHAHRFLPVGGDAAGEPVRTCSCGAVQHVR